MFRVIKLALYAVMGYAIYELIQGLLSEPRRVREAGSRHLERALNTPHGRMQTLTGPGLGYREETLDPDGGMVPHQVGRGVIAR
jgi:hypothetical protein